MAESPFDLVRATDPVTGSHVTITRAAAKEAGARILSSPAVDDFGVPLREKPRTDKSGDPAGNDGAKAVPTKKENG